MLDFLLPDVAKNTKFYLDNEKNEDNLRELNSLILSKDVEKISSSMSKRLSFGTAGIRRKMSFGMSNLNDLTIIQITSSFAKYIKQKLPNDKWSVVIGYDGRHNSERWSKLVANVFIKNSITVYLFSAVVPTPFVSYGIIHFKSGAGVMITASHNPKEDNGYKAYWENGAQLTSPIDEEICCEINNNIPPEKDYWNILDLKDNKLLKSADPCIDEYYQNGENFIYHKDENSVSPLKFTYSAFHGVGGSWFLRMMESFGFPKENIFVVKEQFDPNPEFPTLKYPNPEEGDKVLTLCKEIANKNKSKVILANDPDADRIQLAEKQRDDSWYVFTGNEMAAVLTWWIWKTYKSNHPYEDFKKVYVINSVVSSQISKTIAEKEGFQHRVTLTGFKWLGNLSAKLRSEGNEVIFAWEEAIGFLLGSTLDKDGILTGGVLAELVSFLEREKKLMKDMLYEIYKKYGFHLNKNSYFIVTDQNTIKKLFDNIRENKNYPKSIGTYKVKYIRDLTIGYDTEQQDEKPILPISAMQEMITFTLENRSTITLRTSGTEPKIKYYIEYITEAGKSINDLESFKAKLNDLENCLIEEIIKPKDYGLKCKSEIFK
uniref:Phosphoglucomutase-2 n=1 Tax=Parastrongyloides trichosuri TaxID=131310 RepID=A0A0N4Z579_PARTI